MADKAVGAKGFKATWTEIKVENKYSLAFIEIERFSFAIVPRLYVYFTEENKGAEAAEFMLA